jgi:DNA polymerase-1
MKNRIFVIDGSSYLYRAFHAMPPLTTSSGIPTGAVKGVTNMLLNLKKDSEGSPIIVVFDAKGKNFRNEIYADYKANRPPMPTELIDQLKPVKEICKAIGFPLIEINGVEADDVIATISKVAKNNGYKTVISSLDKDLMQLVSDPDVKMMNTMTHQIFDEQKVEEKFGVKPDQIRDLLALVGDSSDNIPGIPKVGQKTAAKWLIKYGSIKKIIENQNEITGVVGENLRNFSTNLQRNIELVSLKQDVNIGIDFEDLLRLNPDEDRLNALFNELEFKAMLTKQNSKKEKVTEKKYDLVLSEKDLQKWIKKIKKANVFAIDTETSSLDILSSELIGISLSISEGEACYIPIGHVYEDCPKQLSLEYIKQHLRPCLEENQNKAVGQNLKFDLPVLNRHGFRIKKFHADTMIMSYILDSTATRHSLDRLAQFYLNKETIKYTDLTGTASKQIPFSQVDLKKAGEYAAEDADITLQLFYCFDEMLKDNNSLNNLLKNIEYPLISVLIEVETNGAKIDNEKLSNHSVELGKRIKMLSADAYELANKEFNLDSPKQLLEVLYTDLGLPVLKKTPKGQPSTNEETLVRLAEEYELPKIILEYRSLAKLKSTYTDSLVKLENPVSKRIHTSYHQAVTSTGRLSSTEPNLQNIPIKNEEGRKIREAFIPESGNILIAADYSQIELRIMAHLSKDKNLVKAFKNNLDVHSSTASEIFEVDIQNVTREQRRSAKAINFGLMYGMTAFGLTRQLGIPRSEAQKYFDAYFSKYTGVQEYMNKTRNSARERSFVETIMGRRLNLKEINSPNGLRRQAAERAAINAPLQGSAADIIKKAMIDIDAFITNKMPELKMIMQVHDELVFEAPENFSNEAIKEIKNIMENCVQLDIPLIVEASIGKNWNEAH